MTKNYENRANKSKSVLGLLLTLILALHSRFFLLPQLSEENLNSFALHIVAVTTLAVLFLIFGAGIRLGGLTISF